MVNYPVGLKIGFKLLSALFYLVSLAIPCYYMESNSENIWGFVCLISGWMVVFYEQTVFIIPWLSNFLFLLCILFGFFRVSGLIVIPTCISAILMAVPAFFVTELPMDEGGGVSAVTLQGGAYIWFLSYVILFISLCIPAKGISNKKQPIPEDPPDINSIP